MNRRSERVAGLLRREIGWLAAARLKDPRLSRMVTLARVEVSDDLSLATVAVTVEGTDDDAAQALSGLRSAAGYVKRELGRRLDLKRAPDLRFTLDESIAGGDRVLGLLDSIKEEES